jgi:hypothetical protein
MAIAGALTILLGGFVLGYAFKSYLADSRRDE